MKNFKPMTAAPKGALCACGDKLGPHFLSLAGGGSVEEGSRARAARNAPGFGDALGALLDMGAGALRGSVKATLGLPGDLESLVRMLGGGAEDATTLPTTKDFDRKLPPLTGLAMDPKRNPYQDLGEFMPLPGTTPVVRALGRGVRKGSGVVARGALGSVQAAMEGQGPLRGALAPVAPAYAVKPRGGNVNDTAVDSLLHEMGHRKSEPTQAWLKKNMRNYLKRDFGAPTDPLLALEKELPGLHLQGDYLEGQDPAHLYNNMARTYGMKIPDDVELPAFFERNPPVDASYAKSPGLLKQKAYLERHNELSGGAPLTRWGRAADSNIMSGKAGEELASELAEKWPIATMYPENGGSLQSLLDHTDNMIKRWEMGARDNGLKAPAGERYEKLLKYRDMLSEKSTSDWRAKTPDAEVFQPMQAAAGDLGFDHMTDYIEAATEPYSKFKQFFGESWVPEGEAAADTAARKADDAALYKRFKDLFESGKSADDLWNNHEFGMTPYRRQDFDRWVALRDAGLLVDPESLPRMGVADVSRKTAAWNEFLANQGPSNEALQKGWKVHKEYGPEGGGMKWVEFGKPADFAPYTAETLPKGYRMHTDVMPEDVPNVEARGKRIYSVVPDDFPNNRGSVADWSHHSTGTPEQALEVFNDWAAREMPRRALKEGLSAEGDAMGHCVGGYCDDVLNRGTRIYSLRDAKGAPHVTVEVRPGSGNPKERAYSGFLDRRNPDLEGYQKWLSEKLAQDESYRNTPGLDAVNEYLASIGKAPIEVAVPPPEIVQIKGKGNAAPVDKYLPMVQDFVRSGKWGRVGDLGNTGLRQMKDVFGAAELQRMAASGLFSADDLSQMDRYVTVEEAIDMMRKSGLSGQGAEAIVTKAFLRSNRGYARGGSVQPDDDAPKGFLPRSFEEWVEYAERLHATTARKN